MAYAGMADRNAIENEISLFPFFDDPSFEDDGDATRAAKSLRIGRSTFYRKAARHRLKLARDDAGRRGARPDMGGVGRPISIG